MDYKETHISFLYDDWKTKMDDNQLMHSPQIVLLEKA